jgi:hypothetical protein
VACSGWQVVGCQRARAGYRRASSADSYRRHSTFYVEAEAATPSLAPRGGELSDAGWFPVAALPEDRSDALELAVRAGWVRAGGGSRQARLG